MVDHHKPMESDSVEPVTFSRPAWSTLVASPLLYGMIIPMIFLDLCLELYHRIIFPLMGIPLVRRWEYIRIDRHRLPFLPWMLKLACAYCGYANGLLQYAGRIAGDTEAYFCPSKHQSAPGFHPPIHHKDFAEYGDGEGFHRRFHREQPDHSQDS